MNLPPDHLCPGDRVRHTPTGDIFTIRGRKADDSGWWMVGTGGLADSVADSGDWELVTW